MSFDSKEQHAQEFTDIERQTLRVWFDLDAAGEEALADAVLNAGLQFEHYTSLLEDDADKRTPAQLAKQQLLAFRLSEQLSLAAEFFRNAQDPKRHDRVTRFRLDALRHSGEPGEEA